MIERVQLVTRLAMFGAALCILGVAVWGLLAGEQHIQTPLWAVWLFFGAALIQFVLWAVSKAASRS